LLANRVAQQNDVAPEAPINQPCANEIPFQFGARR